MKKLVLILAVLNLVGCSESAKRDVSDNLRAVGLPSLASKPPLTDADKISLLRTEAHRRGLRWRGKVSVFRKRILGEAHGE